MDIEILCGGKTDRYMDVIDIKYIDGGWIEFDCASSFCTVFPITSSLLSIHNTEHLKVKGEIIRYWNI